MILKINLQKCLCGCGSSKIGPSACSQGHWTRIHREEISRAAAGRKNPHTPEWDAKIAASNEGKKKSPEHRLAMSIGRKGMKLSESHKKQIQKSLSAAYADGSRKAWNLREDREQMKKEKRAARFMRNSLHRCLSLSGTKKEDKTFEILGYTPLQLIEHIEKNMKFGMTWENYGLRGWHIDHMKAIAEFDELDPKKVNSFENLQPMWASENISKGAVTRWSGRRKIQ